MKRTILFSIILACFGAVCAAQSPTVKQANEFYAKGRYSDAAQLYESALLSEGVAPQLYFNLGNAYYKSNEVGKSILNYERALRLSPNFEDAAVNLEMARMKVIDNVVQPPSFFVGRWIENLIKLLTSNQWLYLSSSLFVIGLVALFLFIFNSLLAVRKGAFYAVVAFFSLSLFTLIFSGVRKHQLLNHQEAVVMMGAVTVKSSPDKSGTDLFQLHEGTKVTIKGTLGSWTEIKLGNGSVGWVEQRNIEAI